MKIILNQKIKNFLKIILRMSSSFINELYFSLKLRKNQLFPIVLLKMKSLIFDFFYNFYLDFHCFHYLNRSFVLVLCRGRNFDRNMSLPLPLKKILYPPLFAIHLQTMQYNYKQSLSTFSGGLSDLSPPLPPSTSKSKILAEKVLAYRVFQILFNS